MIKPINNSPNFKAVYFDRDTMTSPQKKIASSILHQFRYIDFSDQKSRTFEENYERMGIDFVIKPAEDGQSVKLDAYRTKEKYLDKKNNKFAIKGPYSRVGKYGYTDYFKMQDVENTTLPPEDNSALKLFGMLFAVAAVVAMPIMTHVRKSINPSYLNTDYLKADSVSKADTITHNTFKMIKNLK